MNDLGWGIVLETSNKVAKKSNAEKFSAVTYNNKWKNCDSTTYSNTVTHRKQQKQDIAALKLCILLP